MPRVRTDHAAMFKKPHVFGWENEPVDERPSAFMDSTHFSRLSAFQGLNDPFAKRGGPILDPVAKREPPSPHEIKLSSLALSWAESLPDELAPVQLCARHPRIANRLALCASDPKLMNRMLDALLTDDRGGRRGFGAEVTKELKALRSDALRRFPKITV